MTNRQKILAIKLLKGWCLVKDTSRKKRPVYRVLDDKKCEREVVPADVVLRMDKIINPEIKIWKVDHFGRITFNLSSIRKLHGRHTLKRLYKQREFIEIIYHIQTRQNRKKILKAKDDKELTLF